MRTQTNASSRLCIAVALGLAGCASAPSASIDTSVARICAGSCPVQPIVPLAETCVDTSPQYLADGSPTFCTYGMALNRVADHVKACAKNPGIVQVTYQFARDGSPRSVRAGADCEKCELPEYPDENTLLRCVERAAAAARLPLGSNKDAFYVAYPYRVGEPEDPRMRLNASPLDVP